MASRMRLCSLPMRTERHVYVCVNVYVFVCVSICFSAERVDKRKQRRKRKRKCKRKRKRGGKRFKEAGITPACIPLHSIPIYIIG